ncbi:MAG: hypothetical protein OEW75_14705 [Cyclobacteriaceae bacterium]|nr:hypothetical protein [Cyclobacteriaceae bacterium]
MSQLVDIPAIREFMEEILQQVSREELISIASDLEDKSSLFKQYLSPDVIDDLTDDQLTEIIKTVFTMRRHYKGLIENTSTIRLKKEIKTLLHGEAPPAERFQGFVDRVHGIDKLMKADLAGELLHFTFPEKFWLWSRWLWDPKNKTGALPLLTTEGFDLESEIEGVMYMKVGKGVAFVHSVGEAGDFQFIGRSLFGTDVYMACVYVVYSYTVLKMRMTQEFNKVMPSLPEFSRRLLGVFKLPEKI